MKKLLAMLLALAMVFSLCACGEEKQQGEDTPKTTEFKAGMVCIGNKEKAYDKNFMMAADAAKEILAKEGINVTWLYAEDHPTDDDKVTTDNQALVEAGCQVVFNNSYGQEAYMLKAAAEDDETVFVGMTSDKSWADDNPKTLNTFASIYEGRYLAGIVAGEKMNELIAAGTIKPEEAVIGYVGAFPYAEVISGFTAFYLGAKSVCPTATMVVRYINDWGNLEDERTCANTLISKDHAVVISQHSDNISPAEAAEAATKAGGHVYHVGYNLNMIKYAEDASMCSPRIDWTNYFVAIIRGIVNGTELPQDYVGTLKDGDVVLDEFNDKLVSAETKKAVEDAAAKLKSGELNVFDTSTFTVGGKALEDSLEVGIDVTGDFVPDKTYKPVFDGVYHESTFRSAPYFDQIVDGVTSITD